MTAAAAKDPAEETPAKTTKKATPRRRTAKRASGAPPADEVAQEQAEDPRSDLETPAAADLPEDRQRIFEALGFSRMKLDWSGDGRAMMDRIKSTVDGAILNHFEDAYRVMSDVYDVVREPAVNTVTGEVQRDHFGYVIWQRSPTGMFQEDWSRLSIRQREDFLYRITTALFEWEQRAADMWGEAMFAKAVWQENFATEYDKPHTGTIEDRTAVGNIKSAEDRYFAIFLSLLSRRADAIVRTMGLLGQRLKDTLA